MLPSSAGKRQQMCRGRRIFAHQPALILMLATSLPAVGSEMARQMCARPESASHQPRKARDQGGRREEERKR